MNVIFVLDHEVGRKVGLLEFLRKLASAELEFTEHAKKSNSFLVLTPSSNLSMVLLAVSSHELQARKLLFTLKTRDSFCSILKKISCKARNTVSERTHLLKNYLTGSS
jgi:hypothetical protein